MEGCCEEPFIDYELLNKAGIRGRCVWSRGCTCAAQAIRVVVHPAGAVLDGEVIVGESHGPARELGIFGA